ncbi:molybdopterin synthase sulfur carrier subunit [Bordetella genomosp. 10]|uniref:Molybdopterin synthase sulfur carrier subunit n=1 Tax=Bordetella genomosp. 10 TaxID=1416804 RepID=A0A261S2M7_9BORD|nr:MoaD/ThiS family protein [Bordetella genomosp. 10]OZI31435.1 molybdopterin synthase sulfur carrier subunit [Bordetella genomosp. 10]
MITSGEPASSTAAGAAIQLLYFARVAELTGRRAERYALPGGGPVTGSDLLAQLGQRYPELAGASRLRLAVNQTHAKPGVLIHAGDEVAVFEPVTGG